MSASDPLRRLWTHLDPESNPPTVGQVNGGIRADDDTLNALQRLASSQACAVSDVG